MNKLASTVNFDDFAETFGKNLIPMDEYEGFKIRPGFYLENGAVVIPGGVSFTVHSQHATSVKVVLFKREEYSFFDKHKNIFSNSPSIRHFGKGIKKVVYPANYIAGTIRIPSLIEVLLVIDEELAA